MTCIGAVKIMTRIAERGVEGFYSDGKPKLGGYEEAMHFMDETIVQEDEFLRYRITERFNQILRDVHKDYAVNLAEDANMHVAPMTEMAEGILSALNQVKAGDVQVGTLGDALGLMMEKMGMEDVDLFAGLLEDSVCTESE